MHREFRMFDLRYDCSMNPGCHQVLSLIAGFMVLVVPASALAEADVPASQRHPNVFARAGRGIVQEVKAAENSLVIKHEAIPGYMNAMTMPFKVKDSRELSGLRVGDQICFQLHVTDTESWIGGISRTGAVSAPEPKAAAGHAAKSNPARARHPLLDYGFTNELGQVVKLADFSGQAFAITFLFTRCPVPDYCPRLSQNFQEACHKLSAIPNGPTNWHFLSVSFDTQFDTPARLRVYGEQYGYDPNHWSFLTGPLDKIGELAAQSDAKFDKEGGLFNHNFRTLIIDATGRLQIAFPVGGNLADAIVEQMLRAATARRQ
jgi:protein SCO1